MHSTKIITYTVRPSAPAPAIRWTIYAFPIAGRWSIDIHRNGVAYAEDVGIDGIEGAIAQCADRSPRRRISDKVVAAVSA